MTLDADVKDVLMRDNHAPEVLAGSYEAGSITPSNTNRSEGIIYKMPDQATSRIQAVEVPKTMGQTYYEEVEALKAGGLPNADAVRQVAESHGKNENAVRGGIHQYKSRHVNGNASAAPRRSRSTTRLSYDDYLANARSALESARDLIDQEVAEAKQALDAARARYDEVVASVKDRKADIEKKLKALA